ncbi:hypothetical protein BT96DRAFT_1007441 [Gymnopus androsaceus JB14]|uniref:Uncharacterized protein n=1 Tax=Gymnopus androsaceus JB14 TaxID=1447944 RepID=A0A6A4GHU3_9AGAR|nr:hypothetical protein BT96DRAFT_1007441 [Gymnopus androsaceus JB14]
MSVRIHAKVKVHGATFAPRNRSEANARVVFETKGSDESSAVWRGTTLITVLATVAADIKETISHSYSVIAGVGSPAGIDVGDSSQWRQRKRAERMSNSSTYDNSTSSEASRPSSPPRRGVNNGLSPNLQVVTNGKNSLVGRPPTVIHQPRVNRIGDKQEKAWGWEEQDLGGVMDIHNWTLPTYVSYVYTSAIRIVRLRECDMASGAVDDEYSPCRLYY